ncbi:hypothetical protein KM792_04215 [Clostridium tyrobutyricum]|uniref:hypothetical protein n=1 Tax=Clostridium tyrobutyricum TaxID=1519 RepID=UPI001C39137B|nr:hypothetical protein [Clostridium tyrobutyricum]MBV4448872.1 hypothetical protein [Clostridium tyrobutyricum]
MLIGIVVIILFIVHLVVAKLIVMDCNKRNMNIYGWGIFTLFLPIFAILIYLVVRNPRQYY